MLRLPCGRIKLEPVLTKVLFYRKVRKSATFKPVKNPYVYTLRVVEYGTFLLISVRKVLNLAQMGVNGPETALW